MSYAVMENSTIIPGLGGDGISSCQVDDSTQGDGNVLNATTTEGNEVQDNTAVEQKISNRTGREACPCTETMGDEVKKVLEGSGESTGIRGAGYIDEIKRKKFEKKAKSKLFVGGLTTSATEDFLYATFEKYGDIMDACIVYEKSSHISRGFGYVTFGNEKDAKEAIKGADGMRVNGKTLCVEFADDPKFTPRRPAPRRRSRSPPRRYGLYPSPPVYRDRYSDRDRFYERDPYYERDRYPQDCYDSDRYYRREAYDSYPQRDHYRSPPPPGYYDYESRGPPIDYKDRFGRDIPRARARGSWISDVDQARLRVDRERLRLSDRHEEDRYRSRDYGFDRRHKSYVEDYCSKDYTRDVGDKHARNLARDRSSDSNSSDDDNSNKKDTPKSKPRQVSAFPSAYLS